MSALDAKTENGVLHLDEDLSFDITEDVEAARVCRLALDSAGRIVSADPEAIQAGFASYIGCDLHALSCIAELGVHAERLISALQQSVATMRRVSVVMPQHSGLSEVVYTPMSSLGGDEPQVFVELYGERFNPLRREAYQLALTTIEQALEASTDGYLVVEVASQRLLRMNGACRRLVGGEVQPRLGDSIQDSFQTIDLTGRLRALIVGAGRAATKASGILLEGAETPVWVEAEVRQQELVGLPVVVVRLRDVSAHHLLMSSSREADRRLELVLDFAGVGIADYDFVSGMVTFDEVGRVLRGLDRPRVTIAEAFAAIIPEDRIAVVRNLLRSRHDGVRDVNTEYRVVQSDGTHRWLLGRGRLMFNDQGHPVRFLGAVRDISEQRRTEQLLRSTAERLEREVNDRTAELARANQRLIDASRMVARAEYLERRRVASVLHDDLQQGLYSLGLRLRALQQRIPAEFFRSVTELADLVSSTLQMTRGLVVDLAPPLLDGEGGVEALRWLVSDLRRRLGLVITLELDPSLPETVDVPILVQAARELALHASHLHGAQVLRMRLSRQQAHLVLEVGEDGSQSEARAEHDAELAALSLLSERIHLCGGELQMHRDQQSCVWTVSVPSALEAVP